MTDDFHFFMKIGVLPPSSNGARPGERQARPRQV
jgi:hypothetical protein